MAITLNVFICMALIFINLISCSISNQSNIDPIQPSDSSKSINVTVNKHQSLENGIVELLDAINSGKKVLSSNYKNYINCTEHNKLCELISSNKCLTSKSVLDILPSIEQNVSSRIFPQLCPLLLFQQENKNCQKEVTDEKLKPTLYEIWGYGLLFVTLISVCSVAGVLVLPFLNAQAYNDVVMLFQGLAVGSLVSSAAFHLIPQGFNLLGKDNTHGYLYKALLIFFGIYAFYLSERIMKIFMSSSPKTNSYTCAAEGPLLNGSSNGKACNKSLNGVVVVKPEEQNDHNNHQTHHHHHNNKEISYQPGKDSVIRTVAWMVVLGDGFHNFIDGLSIGAAFSESILSGISISVAVLCEEFPHELGDFAVLLAAGMTIKQALFYNFLSACTCYLGFVFGAILGDLTQSTHYIFAFAGGMFLYIALVDMMGELNEGLEKVQKEGNILRTLRMFFLQNLGILIGVVVLFLLARYSEHINFDGFGSLSEFGRSLYTEPVNTFRP